MPYSGMSISIIAVPVNWNSVGFLLINERDEKTEKKHIAKGY